MVTSAAATCGIDKDGIERVLIGPAPGAKDDALYADVQALRSSKLTDTTFVVPLQDVLDNWRAVPIHYDSRTLDAFDTTLAVTWPGWAAQSIGELIDRGWVIRRDGHGSPSKDQRKGEVPYIKVSDLRAGLVNINPTNMVPRAVAKTMWRDSESGLRQYDLLSPERASSNIGEFCLLMPGQEDIVVTREVIILRVTDAAPFDSFYMLWALSLKVVRDQWNRLTFMQTNREDVGHRYREVLIPMPLDKNSGAFNHAEGESASSSFRSYFEGMAKLRLEFSRSLAENDLHHFAFGTPRQ